LPSQHLNIEHYFLFAESAQNYYTAATVGFLMRYIIFDALAESEKLYVGESF
jgi:F0F1-type ATP synthase assembly protein I